MLVINRGMGFYSRRGWQLVGWELLGMNVRALGTMGNTPKHGIKKEKRLRKLKNHIMSGAVAERGRKSCQKEQRSG